jgi:hypothetical protein
MKTFKQFFEDEKKKKVNKDSSKGLDISIKHLEKEIKTLEQKEAFLNDDIIVTEKFDGTKLTLIRTSTPKSKNYSDNWIIAYKGSIISAADVSNLDADKVKKQSIGISQYKIVHDHLKEINSSLDDSIIIPGTEYFVEFMQRKDTLTREYAELHGMILLSKAQTDYKVTGTRLLSNPKTEMTFDIDKDSEALEIPAPPKVYQGKSDSKETIRKNIISDSMKEVYDNIDDFEETTEGLFDVMVKLFQEYDSVFGGTPEGTVINTTDGKILKVVQQDQYDAETRNAIKNKYRYDHETMQQYWDYVTKYAEKVLDGIDKEKSIEEMLHQLSDVVRNQSTDFNPPDPEGKREDQIQRDDLYLTTKMRLEKLMKGNRYAMFIGRFQPSTVAHEQIVRDALDRPEVDGMVIAIVAGAASSKNKDQNPLTYEERVELWEKALKDVTKPVVFYKLKTGSIGAAVRGVPYPVFYILAGEDRAEGYRKQMKGDLIDLIEIPRSEEDVSASKLRAAIKSGDFDTAKTLGGSYMDEETFKQLQTKI